MFLINTFMRSISQVFKGSAEAFKTFPAAIGCALAFAVVTMIRIQLDWPQQEPYNFLFNCLHWSFALGAIFSLAAITAAKSRFDGAKAFITANLLGLVAAALTFLGLYLFGATDPIATGSSYATVTGLAASRVSVAILISFLAFIVLAGYPKDQSDFAKALFMTTKAFFIALIYGAVILGGTTGVAGAVEALLYHDMSEKVYMYLATLSGFLMFTIFVGYFPDFRKGKIDEHRDVAQKQPRFIEILFVYIMIPIVMALTVVLFIWAGRTVIGNTQIQFIQLYSIATSYAVGGIWLHMMVTHHESGLAKFYRRFYPIAALIILAFEAWALMQQLGKSGLKITEYSFSIIWVIAVVSAVLLIAIKAKSHVPIIALTCAMAVISVLPVVGYHALPVTAQVNRLEQLLVSQDMLKDGNLVPAATEPDRAVRESITDAVDYLAYTSDAKLPGWFDKHLGENDVFKAKLGFEKIWPENDNNNGGGYDNILSTYLYLPSAALDIGDYRWAISTMNEKESQGKVSNTIVGEKGTYEIYWSVTSENGIPYLRILKDGKVIIDQDLKGYIDKISAKYPPGKAKSYKPELEDMCLRIETPEVNLLLVFNNVQINLDPQRDTINYWLSLDAIYVSEK
ncbi:MAG: DUF4153 domain-containing protein [Clostridiaceae bacterium]